MLVAVDVLLYYLTQATILASIFCGSVCVATVFELGCNEYFLYKLYTRTQSSM